VFFFFFFQADKRYIEYAVERDRIRATTEHL